MPTQKSAQGPLYIALDAPLSCSKISDCLMADVESFSASMVELQKKSDQLDKQLSVEQQRARALQLSASSFAEKREVLIKDIRMVMSELCELEMEAEDSASLQPHNDFTTSVPRPGQKVPCIVQSSACTDQSKSIYVQLATSGLPSPHNCYLMGVSDSMQSQAHDWRGLDAGSHCHPPGCHAHSVQ